MTVLSSVVRPARVKRGRPPATYNAAMDTIRRFTVAFVAAAVLVAGLATPSAHEVTHNGTVVALKTARYAQPGGGTREVRELEVAVVDHDKPGDEAIHVRFDAAK